MKFISYPKVINSAFFILLFLLGCNKQSEPLQYDDPIWTKDFDGYSRDMYIQNDTLFAVNEDEGLLIYKLEMDTLTNTLTFDLLYYDSPYYQNKDWDLSGILFSDMKKIIEENPGPIDLRLENLGYYNNKLVLLDFGIILPW